MYIIMCILICVYVLNTKDLAQVCYKVNYSPLQLTSPSYSDNKKGAVYAPIYAVLNFNHAWP